MRLFTLLFLPLLSGCVALVLGADPPSRDTLLDREWRITSLSGEAPGSSAVGTLRFGSDGRFTGRSFCNRFTSTYTLDGATLSVGDIAATRMACTQEVMADEYRLFELLGRVNSVRVTGDLLVVRGGDGVLIEARPHR